MGRLVVIGLLKRLSSSHHVHLFILTPCEIFFIGGKCVSISPYPIFFSIIYTMHVVLNIMQCMENFSSGTLVTLVQSSYLGKQITSCDFKVVLD